MAKHNGTHARTHIVFIPGFAGFDMLGQLEYYSGLTPVFAKWRNRTQRAVVLHYFDNFPTASVAVRAERLQRYLAKRIARQEFVEGDEICLVGHSTGGLDIRRLICDLAQPPDEGSADSHKDNSKPNSKEASDKSRKGESKPFLNQVSVDGTQVEPNEILKMIKKIVFVSVPQWGTNIADWVHHHQLGKDLVLANLRLAVEISHISMADTLRRWTAAAATIFSGTNLLYALQDSLNEAEVDPHGGEAEKAYAEEAAAFLVLWLHHMATDFEVIHDLAVPDMKQASDATVPDKIDACKSPAHFTVGERDKEKEIWQKCEILTRSYATVAPNPFVFAPGPVPVWEPLNLSRWVKCVSDANKKTDIFYRLCYRACAGGPFEWPPDSETEKARKSANLGKLELWDNDGIVNTCSMFWPNGAQTRLVNCDHMDIVGHFNPDWSKEKGDRIFRSYDLLVSGAAFQERTFKSLWENVFEFCSEEEAATTTGKRAKAAAGQ